MYIKINDKKYPCTGKQDEQDGDGIVFSGVTGLDKPPTSGVIKWFADDGFELGAADVAVFKRCVLEGETLTLTDTPAPTPPTEAELLASARTAAQERISGKCSTAICSGVTVDGKHYALSDRDQLSLNAAWAQVNGGAATVPYAADGEALTDYTAAQITAVGKAAYDWGIVCRTYYGLLYQWVQRETDRDKLACIQYGSKLPDDLMQALAATLQGAGIDVTKYSGMFTAYITYDSANGAESEDDMTGKETYDRLNEYLRSVPCPDAAKAELQEAIDLGITDGGRPLELTPRYQTAIMAKRAVKGKK